MNARDRHGAVEDGDADHELLLSYLNSAAWQERLVEARAKRQAIVDALPHGATRPNLQSRNVGRLRPRPATQEPAGEPAGIDVPVEPLRRRTDFARRWPLALPAAGLSLVMALAGALVVWSGFDGIDAVAPDPQIDSPVTAPGDVVTRNRTDNLSEIGAVAKPEPVAIASLSGIDALAASLEELALTNSITVVTSLRQVEALDSLDRTKAAATVRMTPFELDRATVSFYHPDDAGAAARLAASLDGETMDLTGLLPTPPAGTLSVYLAGS